MKIRELVEALEDFAAEHGEDVEVRLATQEAWPFECALLGVAGSDEIAVAGEEEDEEEEVQADPDAEQPTPILYLVEGKQLAYGRRAAWSVARSRLR
jgi:hypothetical protein